ncbi:MAG: hypothetical protein APF81_02065 [Desulfosporosinus sp. BRH_c37]|nr:MAG: hypothetical protein APF81_02065 [Desulfosporosinus sp. BRH_c37]
MKKKRRLIDEILEIELTMILTVSSKEKSRIQENSSTFKVVRECGFKQWSIQTLQSYLTDLKNAQKRDLNLMELKYARMDDLIPPLNLNPIIDNIVKLEAIWDKRTKRGYPNIFKASLSNKDEDDTRLARYLRAEFETFSDSTLSYYYINLLEAVRENRNLVEECLTCIFKSIGYQSLAEANLFMDAGPKN